MIITLNANKYESITSKRAYPNYLQGITPIEPCGVGYWTLSAFQFPLAIVYTAWILWRRESPQHQNLNEKVQLRNDKY